MSMNLMAKAMNQKVGNPLRKLVLLKLADNANDKGECWPSYQHIADQCECSRSAVKSHITTLIKMGFLTKENRLGENNGKGNTSNVYYLKLDNPGASESIGGSPENPPGASENPPPGASENPRTSHSSEPVNEPVIGEPAKADSPSQPAEKIDYQKILDVYHDTLPEMAQVKILTDARKKTIRNFWKKFKFNSDRWEAYLRYIASNCRWMLEDRPNGRGGFWKRKNLDYLVTERCYVAVKEERANDQ
ncbi:helix-turn-helix domain-containing protein [Brenneria tiliae]|uniref:helix-turn-helix domain-containing protein n=1 Tax=Brenneria tiliae TaxID=2914984 RepID=UPI002014E8CB|nr:helix-turn-helix domain-containing protein [Brenneria tiliae]MCL2899764.1 helix-turn-helix domain-containing protein [Brenneria tiliae]MCL2904747.1 helix-turn-helix domain-containing protein [Brenneria tiliae]